jgi:hypothetical protein
LDHIDFKGGKDLGDAHWHLEASWPYRLDSKEKWARRGVAELTDNRPPLTNLVAYAEAENFHRIPSDRQGSAFAGGWTTPWVLKNAEPLRRPVPYIHPNGAVKSVNLSDDVAAQMQRQLAG